MALQAIVQAIAADAEAKAGAILNDADSEVKRRLAAARMEAISRREMILSKARIAAEHERSRLLHRSRLDVSRFLVAAQEEAFQDILQAVSVELNTVRQRSDYPDLFKSLLQEALASVSGSVKVSVDPVDLELAAGLLPADRSVELVPGPATCGGVIVSTDDGRVVTHNTLESRLERALPDLRPLLGPLLRQAMNAPAGKDSSNP